MVDQVTNCEKIWQDISNYIDGDIDAVLRSSMDEHFKTCARCTSVLAGMKNVLRLYGDERMLEMPAGFSGRLEKRLAKSAVEKGSVWSSFSAWLIPMAAMALVAGGMVLTSSLTHGHFLKSRHAEPGNNIPPDLTVVVSSGARLFHVPGCSFIHDKASERTMTAKQAIQEGYMPCTRCLRQYLKTGLIPEYEQDHASDEADDDRGDLVSTAGR